MRRLPLVLALALLPACATITQNGVEKEVFLTDAIGYEVYGIPATDAPAGNPTWVAEIRTKKKAAGNAYGVLRANRRLYPPFEVLAVAGLTPGKDQAGFGPNSQICVELDERASFSEDIGTLLWVLVCAKREGTGLRVRAQDQFVQLGSVLLPNTDAAILVVRHDGTDLIFETAAANLPAPADGGAFTEITRIDNWLPVAAGDALVPSFGASFLAHPASVMLSRAQVVSNGEPPESLTALQAAAFDVGAAVDAVVRAFELINGPTPQPTDARVELEGAQAGFEAALADLEALLPDKAAKKGRAAVKAAIKAVIAAIAKIDDEKPAKKILRDVGKAAGLGMRAVQKLDPLPEH